MPLPLSELSAMSSEAASRARARLEAIPPSGSDDDSLQDALSALEDFIELAVSKVCLWVVYTGDLFFQCSGVDWIMLCDMLHAWGIFDLRVWLSSVAMKSVNTVASGGIGVPEGCSSLRYFRNAEA